ncbi:MAG: hypothetical protein ACOYNY_16810 [Caldilineaceae bacterium]|jgi:hypothetical protein
MAYNRFTIEELKAQFGIQIHETADFFMPVTPVASSDLLLATLHENVPLALANSTEKARSEMIIAPILIEVRRQLQRSVSLFSGIEFNVDPERGLVGVCDYLFSLSAEQLTLEAPVVAIVEAKNENIKQGIGQCIAEMIGAALFNARRNNSITIVYGVVTTGNNWKFLRLVENTVYIDVTEYYIKEIDKIVGILLFMMRHPQAASTG